jgi:molybdopterin synthase sulfur carrier subunit
MSHFIELKFFASIREQLGLAAQTFELAEPRSVGVIRLELAARGGAWERSLGPQQRVLVAVNQEVVDDQTLVQPGDELAFFPPVTGG